MPILLFDGECNLCNGIVQFVIKRDPDMKFRFASLQNKAGKELLDAYNVPHSFVSFVLIENNKVYQKSDAVLRVCKGLDGGWAIFSRFSWVPKWLRDFLYTFVAKNRYRWFGKRASCMIPTKDLTQRFLDE